VTEAAAIVFVVDDDPSVRRSTERLVRSAGFEVKTFGSAAEFLESPQPEGPACLVLDVRMPGRSGLDLQRELTGSGIQIPIIFVNRAWRHPDDRARDESGSPRVSDQAVPQERSAPGDSRGDRAR